MSEFINAVKKEKNKPLSTPEEEKRFIIGVIEDKFEKNIDINILNKKENDDLILFDFYGSAIIDYKNNQIQINFYAYNFDVNNIKTNAFIIDNVIYNKEKEIPFLEYYNASNTIKQLFIKKLIIGEFQHE